MRVLLLTLHAPIASWGDHGARTSRRGSWSRPTRTAILGLVAAALGIERSAHEHHLALHQGLGFAVRVDATGHSLVDYHTYQAGLGDHMAFARTRRDELSGMAKTSITHREYRADALYTVALWTRGPCPWTLEDIRDAVRRPHWMLYLGRKACVPALPLCPTIVEAEDVPAAFELRLPLPSAIAAHLPIRLDATPTIASDVDAPGVSRSRIEQRRDGYHYTSGDLRTYVERQEYVMVLPRRERSHAQEDL
jgi:CRISPR system Cascade subunit CasD